jgi:beta-fructofuranosidase
MTLKEANLYIEKNRIDEDKKPAFHVTAPVGWINDPNGFSVYEGKVHLFYQYHPYDVVWGPMHWGHCKSDDMISWDELPVALAPDEGFDKNGCFSGSAIELDGKQVLFYTGVTEEEQSDGTMKTYQNQCVAIGDGVTYKKAFDNPVLHGSVMPEDCNEYEFRDPRVWKADDGYYYMLAGNKTYDDEPQVVMFKSANISDWEFVSVFARDVSGRFGAVWECPDFFENGEKKVLIVSPQDMEADDEFHNGNNVVCFIGDTDDAGTHFEYDKALALDYGFDFYAPQTIKHTDGRRILIGWMQSWDSTNNIPKNQKWAGMMTIPREFVLDGDMLYQNPVREIENYRGKKNVVDTDVSKRVSFDEIQGRFLDMTVNISGNDYDEMAINVACDDRHRTSFVYNRKKNIFSCDRTYAGFIRDTNCYRTMKVKNPEGIKKLRFILDRNSVEVFVNDGEQVFSTVIYTEENARSISFQSDKTAHIRVESYELVRK